MAPLYFKIPVQSFDLALLPANARGIGSEAFKDAVIRHFINEYADKGKSVVVTVDDHLITIQSLPQEAQTLDPILALLNSGRIQEAIAPLERLAAAEPSDVDVHYNLGIAYSELGRFDEAIRQLKKAVAIEPNHSRSWTGIGVAYMRLRQVGPALDALKRAVAADPGDGYGQRNLGAILCSQKRFEEALPHLRKALHQLPDDAQAIYVLAQCLEELGGDHLGEADTHYKDLIGRFPASPMVERARQSRTVIAGKGMRSAVGGGVRMDVVMYIADALEKFKDLGPQRRQDIAVEIALLGQQGLNINDPEQRYTLKSLPGKFSGMHLLAIMYAAFRQIDPSVDAGVDFSKEYDMAHSVKR